MIIIDIIQKIIRLFYNPKKAYKSILDEKKQEKDIFTQIDKVCHMCKKDTGSLFYRFLVVNSKDKKEYFLCSSDCLNKFKEKHSENINDYEIIGYKRCSAYYVCMSTGNINIDCEKRSLLTNSHNLTAAKKGDFCNPGHIGVILASEKISGEIKNFSKKSSKLYRNTFILVGLVLVLSVLNIIFIFRNIYTDVSKKQLNELIKLNSVIDRSYSSVDKNLENINRTLKYENNELRKILIKFNKNILSEYDALLKQK